MIRATATQFDVRYSGWLTKGVKPQNIESHVKVGVADIRYT